MWWAIWCAVVVAGAAAAPASDALAPLSSLDLPQIDSLTTDDVSKKTYMCSLWSIYIENQWTLRMTILIIIITLNASEIFTGHPCKCLEVIWFFVLRFTKLNVSVRLVDIESIFPGVFIWFCSINKRNNVESFFATRTLIFFQCHKNV